MYLFTYLLWVVCPNFVLQRKSLFTVDTFTIYALHNEIVVIFLMLIYKCEGVINNMIDAVLIMLLEFFLLRLHVLSSIFFLKDYL